MLGVYGVLLSLGLALPAIDAQPTQPNANYIFNAIHSSMRQWGSSLNHNGMSFFITTVPEGVELYHGRGDSARVNGTEWLAFEPEHALGFARSGRGPGGPGGPPGRGGGPPKTNDHEASYTADQAAEHARHEDLKKRHRPHEDRPLTHTAGQRERARLPEAEERLSTEDVEAKEGGSHGYLHTYRAKRDLRIMYVDGQSAAKSLLGTLDSQDIVLLHDTPPPTDGGPGGGPGPHAAEKRRRTSDEPGKDEDNKPKTGGPMNEAFRAEHLCDIAEREWQGRIDGFMRMELGFEIILCSFKKGLDVVRITQAKDNTAGGPHGNDDGMHFSHYQAVASRFDGIGGDRVRVDFDDFVTLFAQGDALYWDEKTGLPRARNDTEKLKPTRKAIKDMVFREQKGRPEDWQGVADLVIARYADRIATLASGDIEDVTSFQKEANLAIRPFIDYGNRNRSLEVGRCATQYFPKLPPATNLAATSILNVTTTLCSSLSDAAEAKTLEKGLKIVRDLKHWLAWTTWKKCRGCAYNEVCFVPVWPMGSEEDMKNPKCVSSMSQTSNGYWGGFGGPPRKGE